MQTTKLETLRLMNPWPDIHGHGCRTVADLYGYVKAFIEPDIIYIDANKERQDYIMKPCRIRSCAVDDQGECPVRSFVYEIAEARNCDVIAER
jgi:hypothetical protein